MVSPTTVVWTGTRHEYRDWLETEVLRIGVQGLDPSQAMVRAKGCVNVTTRESLQRLRGRDLRNAELVCHGTWNIRDYPEMLSELRSLGLPVPPSPITPSELHAAVASLLRMADDLARRIGGS